MEGKTIEQLKSFLKKNNVTGYSKMNKAELVKAAKKIKGGRNMGQNQGNNIGYNYPVNNINVISERDQNFAPPLREGRQYPPGYNMQEDIQRRLAALRRNNRN